MSNPRLIRTPRPDTGSEVELEALASVYRFILNCRAKKKTAESTPELDSRDGAKIKEDSASENYTR
jgi:hypothetical protein